VRPAPETWNGQAWSKVAFTRGNTGMLTGDGITSIPQGGP
jgi:hypothetical protein